MRRRVLLVGVVIPLFMGCGNKAEIPSTIQVKTPDLPKVDPFRLDSIRDDQKTIAELRREVAEHK